MYWNREANLLTVIFDSMGGSEVPDQSLRKDSNIIKPQDPVMEGSVFSGWYKDLAYTAPWDFDNDTVTEDIILYAKWLPAVRVIYTVIFDKNGGDTDAVPAAITAEHDSLITWPDTHPTRVGFGFGGWYKEADCINIWDFDVDTVDSDITLYARWLQNAVIVTLSIEEIVSGNFEFDPITISRTASGGYSSTATVSVNGSEYDAGSIRWEIAGKGAYEGQSVVGTGAVFIVDAADVRYNTAGGHSLVIEVGINGSQYRGSILFTIVE